MINLLPRHISNNGLSEFVLDRLPARVILDVDAVKRILENSNDLNRFDLTNLIEIDRSSLDRLIDMSCDMILTHPPKLTEINLKGLGISPE